MTPELERFYEPIGQEAVDLADGLSGRLVVYAAMWEGVESVVIFYEHESRGVRAHFCAMSRLSELVYSYWESLKKHTGREWRILCFVLDGTSFSIDVSYPEQVDKGVMTDYKPVLEKYFPGKRIDERSFRGP
jgi:hypothetical protein